MVSWLENVKLHTKEHYRSTVVADLFLTGVWVSNSEPTLYIYWSWTTIEIDDGWWGSGFSLSERDVKDIQDNPGSEGN